MAKRGRPAKYTAAERKQLKHYRNQIYYYGRRLAAHNFKYGYNITLYDIRSRIGEINSPDPLIEIFNDDYLYYEVDFRQVAIDEGGALREELDSYSQSFGYGSIEEYEKSQSQGQKWQAALDKAVEEYEKLRK